MKKALLVIDMQKDYFEGGRFPLWNVDNTLENVVDAMKKAESANIPVILIKHVANAAKGIAPFFNEGTKGCEIHPEILKAAPDAEVVIKQYADGFHKTNLGQILSTLGIEEILICGMMTQNCVTHTAISKDAEKYKVKVLKDCCTTVNEAIHQIALNGLSTRVDLVDYEDVM